MRNVIVASTASNQAKRISTSATTWGELRVEREVAALISGDVEAIVNPGKVTLGRDESLLPTGDFQLYLIPKKNKAGAADYSGIGEAIAAAISKAASIATDDEVETLKDDLIEVVADHFGVEISQIDGSEQNEGDVELKAALEEAKSM